jgi:hypothetical protein
MASEVSFFATSLTSSVVESDYILTNAVYNTDGSITIQPAGSATLNLVNNPDIPWSLQKFISKYVKVDVDFTDDGVASDSYTPKAFIDVFLAYTDDTRWDSNILVLNRDIELLNAVYTNTATIETIEKEVKAIYLQLKNNSESIVVIKKISVHKSQDISYSQVKEVVQDSGGSVGDIGVTPEETRMDAGTPFRVEVRSDDPPNPVAGQVWLIA